MTEAESLRLNERKRQKALDSHFAEFERQYEQVLCEHCGSWVWKKRKANGKSANS